MVSPDLLSAYNRMFLLDVQKYLRYQTMHSASPSTGKIARDEAKLPVVINKLVDLAHELGYPERFVIRAYAYVYVEVYKCKTLNKVYLQLADFMQRFKTSGYVVVRDEDVDAAFDVERAWLDMRNASIHSLPLNIRKMYAKKNPTSGGVFFTTSRNFITFSQIACYIRENRWKYPMLHGYQEFFLHQPIMRGPGSYRPEQYVSPHKWLDWYYKEAYGVTDPGSRLSEILNTVPITEEQLECYRHSNLWCAKEVVEKLEKDLVKSC